MKFNFSSFKKYKCAICCIAKYENNYIREFVEHHKKIGFNNIILYDNNDIDGESFETVIADYINSGFVIIENFRGIPIALIKSYNHCYKKYSKQYNWIAFIDVDEFIELSNNMSINLFFNLNCFTNTQCIRLCWKQYKDSNLIYTPNNYSRKRFTEYWPLSSKFISTCTKVILKTNIKNIQFNSPHGPLKNNIICVNSKGQPCENTLDISNQTWDNAYIAHYRFRTIHEYITNKMKRLWPTTYGNCGKDMLNIDFFFLFNKITPLKKLYAEKLINNKT